MSRYTYFAWSEHLQLMKIGKTNRPKDRMVKLPGNPKLVALVFHENLSEAEALDAFKDHRKHGEWFDISETDVAAFLQDEEIDSLEIAEHAGNRPANLKVTLPKDQVARLFAYAKSQDRSVSSVVRQACAEKLERDAEPQPEEAA